VVCCSSYVVSLSTCFCFFVFNDLATTEIYTLSLHDALPISAPPGAGVVRARGEHPDLPDGGDRRARVGAGRADRRHLSRPPQPRSEEHTSELQSQSNLVCRLLLEKKKYTI